MLERTDVITNEVLEPITFVLAYPAVYTLYTVTVLQRNLGFFQPRGRSDRVPSARANILDLTRHSTELHYKQIHYCTLQTVLSISSKGFRRWYIELSTGWFVAFVLCLVFKNDHHVSGTGFVFVLS